jgi:F0F1-type ATP synthase assembly protein I
VEIVCLGQNKNNIEFKYLNIASSFFADSIVGIVIGYIFGYYLDKWIFNSEKKLFIIIFIVLGSLSGVVKLILRSIRLSKIEESKTNEE